MRVDHSESRSPSFRWSLLGPPPEEPKKSKDIFEDTVFYIYRDVKKETCETDLLSKYKNCLALHTVHLRSFLLPMAFNYKAEIQCVIGIVYC